MNLTPTLLPRLLSLRMYPSPEITGPDCLRTQHVNMQYYSLPPQSFPQSQ